MLITGIILSVAGIIALAIVCSELENIENGIALFATIVVIFGSLLIGSTLSNLDDIYKKAIFNNPYEAKIEYRYNKDSVLVPSDTIYVLKKD